MRLRLRAQGEIPKQELQLGTELGIPSWNCFVGRCHILAIMLGWIPACLRCPVGRQSEELRMCECLTQER